jgi:hypothetical protein
MVLDDLWLVQFGYFVFNCVEFASLVWFLH